MPIRAIVTDGPKTDCKEAIPLIQNLPCKALFVDRGYESDEIISTGYVLRKRIEKFNVLTTKLLKKTPSHRKTLSFV